MKGFLRRKPLLDNMLMVYVFPSSAQGHLRGNRETIGSDGSGALRLKTMS